MSNFPMWPPEPRNPQHTTISQSPVVWTDVAFKSQGVLIGQATRDIRYQKHDEERLRVIITTTAITRAQNRKHIDRRGVPQHWHPKMCDFRELTRPFFSQSQYPTLASRPTTVSRGPPLLAKKPTAAEAMEQEHQQREAYKEQERQQHEGYTATVQKLVSQSPYWATVLITAELEEQAYPKQEAHPTREQTPVFQAPYQAPKPATGKAEGQAYQENQENDARPVRITLSIRNNDNAHPRRSPHLSK